MDIALRVKNLVSTYNTHDPIRIAKLRGIDVNYYDLGNIKGIYKKILGNRYIALNENLNEFCLLIASAHELGHDVLHSTKQIQLMKDCFILPKNGIIEIQANKFTAELLLYEGATYEHLMHDNKVLGKQIINTLIDLKNSNIK